MQSNVALFEPLAAVQGPPRAECVLADGLSPAASSIDNHGNSTGNVSPQSEMRGRIGQTVQDGGEMHKEGWGHHPGVSRSWRMSSIFSSLRVCAVGCRSANPCHGA